MNIDDIDVLEKQESKTKKSRKVYQEAKRQVKCYICKKFFNIKNGKEHRAKNHADIDPVEYEEKLLEFVKSNHRNMRDLTKETTTKSMYDVNKEKGQVLRHIIGNGWKKS